MKLSKYLTQNSNSGQTISTIFKSFFENYEIIKEENLPEIKKRFAEVRNNLFEVKTLKALVRNNETIKLLFDDESFSNSKLKSLTFKHILTQIDPKILEFYEFFLKEFPFSKDSHMLKSKFDEIIKTSLSKSKKKDSLPIKEETPQNVDIYKKKDGKVDDIENEEFKKNQEDEDFGQENLKKSKGDKKIISKTEIENDKKEEGFDSFEEDLEKLKQNSKENEEYDFEAEELNGLFIYIFLSH